MSFADESVQAVWDGMQRAIAFQPVLTDPQMNLALNAIYPLVGGTPDAFSGVANNNAAVGETVYTFYWVLGGVFGAAMVPRPDEGASQEVTGWVRPLSTMRRIDLSSVATNRYGMGGDVFTAQKIGLFWSDTGLPEVVLDATVSMNESTRPPIEELIAAVLESMQSSSVHG